MEILFGAYTWVLLPLVFYFLAIVWFAHKERQKAKIVELQRRDRAELEARYVRREMQRQFRRRSRLQRLYMRKRSYRSNINWKKEGF